MDLPEPLRKRLRIDKFNPAYEGYIEFEIKSTLMRNAGGGDTLSMMSDALSCDSGLDSEFDIEDFEEQSKNPGGGGLRNGRKPAAIIRT